MGSASEDSLTFVLDSISMLERGNPACKTLKSALETLSKPCSHRALAIILDSSDPSAKSQAALRQKLREHLNHWTLWRPVRENVAPVNRVLRGWAGYFHYRNSSAVMDDAMTYTRDRLRRWVWRKHACPRGLWKHYLDSRLHNLYGLYEMPITAEWKAKR